MIDIRISTAISKKSNPELYRFHFKFHYSYTLTISWHFYIFPLGGFYVMRHFVLCMYTKLQIFTFSKHHIFFSPHWLKLVFLYIYILSTSKFYLKHEIVLRSEHCEFMGNNMHQSPNHVILAWNIQESIILIQYYGAYKLNMSCTKN